MDTNEYLYSQKVARAKALQFATKVLGKAKAIPRNIDSGAQNVGQRLTKLLLKNKTFREREGRLQAEAIRKATGEGRTTVEQVDNARNAFNASHDPVRNRALGYGAIGAGTLAAGAGTAGAVSALSSDDSKLQKLFSAYGPALGIGAGVAAAGAGGAVAYKKLKSKDKKKEEE
jgi:hypothetical protein